MITALYVDDEQNLLEIAKTFLERSGEFSVRISTSAKEVLDSPIIQSCDVIISDYLMPGMDEITFLKRVRERNRTSRSFSSQAAGTKMLRSRPSTRVLIFISGKVAIQRPGLLSSRTGSVKP